ncbi:MAG: peptidoglycan DD-metalloendopeptidase family protein [Clostridia bacterium]|nr:peptidoglycan DD-metalloendopeptidase family protein [Clostridia bacterium]
MNNSGATQSRGRTAYHYGVDYACPIGSEIVSAYDGVVEMVDNGCPHISQGASHACPRYTWGNCIKIAHDINRDGVTDCYAYYMHLSNNSAVVSVGTRVKAGQKIALSGSSGGSTGPHLHFEIQPQQRWINDSGLYITDYVAYYMRKPWLLNYTLSIYSASNITNTTATIGFSISPSASPSAWGFKMNGNTYTVSTGNLSCDVATYAGKLQPGKSYSYKTWSDIGGKRWESGTSSFTTTNNKPGSFTTRITADNANIGITDAPTVTWGKSNYTDSYTAVLYDAAGNTVQKKENISASATQFTFNPIQKAGNYTVKITAKNTAGSLASNAVTLTVHPDVTVTFVDADPQSFVDYKAGDSTTAKTLGTSTVHYGKNATAPADPSHMGYTFKSWDGSYSSVKADKTVRATYTINTYTVTFKDTKGNTLAGGTQKVPYYSAATAPAYTPSKPAYIHAGWDKDFSCVTKNMTVTAIEKWYNDNYAVFAEVNSAVRDDTNKGYDVTVTLTNNESKLTTGRLVIVLKTTDGKMLTSSESAAFNLKPNTSRTFNEFIPYENAAAKAYAYVVESYGSMIPIAQESSANVDMGLDWTSWSTQKPAEGTYADGSLQWRKEYRYKTRSTTTSYATSMPGWTRNGYTEVLANSGTIDYVTSWPSGFDKNHWLYGTYNHTPKTANETQTTITRVSTSTIGYLYWHWCRGSFDGWCANLNDLEWNRSVQDRWSNEFWQFHAFFSSGSLGVHNATGYFDYIDGNQCGDTRWWFGRTQRDNLPVYRCTWRTYNKLFNYTKLNDWTDWSEQQLSSYEQVDERTVYRYRPKDTSVEDTSGTVRTISGTLGTDFVNQQVTLYIYKIGEASDYSNEYLAQTQTDANGNYSFTFKLREEPTVQTGDFTVALGVEGSNSLIYLDPIEAPRKAYSVKYYDWDGRVISTQTVYEGDDAVLPDESLYGEREGYTFSHWSDSNLNIRENKEIQAEYTINTYTVVFVDWEARNVHIRTFNHGDPLIAPDFENTDESLNVVWDKLKDGYTTVTQNMVVCTEYNKRVCTVTFSDWEDNVISTQEVEYGTGAAVPELADSDDDYTFLGWKDIETGETLEGYIITGNINIAPVYIYKASVEMPVASVESGTYTEPQTVELSCGTEGATIFYTLDGSDPHGGNAKVYTDPIVVKDYAELSYYAVCINHNDSDVFNNYYIINPESERSGYLPFAELPDYVVDDAAKYDVQYTPGYQFKDTVTADTATAYNAYIQDGWKVESVEPSAWSDWADTQLFESDRIALTFETQEVEYEETVDTITYNRYVYIIDGETQYSKLPVEGFVCTEETVEVEKAYTITFIDGVTAFLDENGTPWFNPSNTIKTVTRTKTQYRSRYNVYTLYKWDETVVYDVPADETRERRSIDMYTYAYPKYSYVAVVPDGIQSDFGTVGTVRRNGSLLVNGSSENIFDFDAWADSLQALPNPLNYQNQGDLVLDRAKDAVTVRTRADAVYTDVYTRYDSDENTLYSMDVKPNTAYTLSFDVDLQSNDPRAVWQMYLFTDFDQTGADIARNGDTASVDSSYTHRMVTTNEGFVFTTGSDASKMRIRVGNRNGTDVSTTFSNITIRELTTKKLIPEFYGYSFDKLYKDADKTQEWNLQTDRITEDTILYATYNALPFKVTFAYADGTEIESRTVNFLEAATAPESIPLPPDYLFLGWDSDAYQCVTEDMVIHARYIASDEYATITLDKTEVSLLAATMVKLNAVASAAGKDILWSSDNEGVAFAEKDGTVRGVAPGTATITATVSDSGESAVCTVTVLPNKDAAVCLLTNSSLGQDSEGYIREVKDGKNTVAEIKKEFANDKLVFTDAKGNTLADTDKVGTGTVISLTDGDTILDSVTVIMTGDVNGDGVINVRDAAMTHRALIGKESANHIQQLAMDCNGDGSVNNKDAAMILQVLVGKAII